VARLYPLNRAHTLPHGGGGRGIKRIFLVREREIPSGQFARDDRVKWDYSGEDVGNRASTRM